MVTPFLRADQFDWSYTLIQEETNIHTRERERSRAPVPRGALLHALEQGTVALATRTLQGLEHRRKLIGFIPRSHNCYSWSCIFVSNFALFLEKGVATVL